MTKTTKASKTAQKSKTSKTEEKEDTFRTLVKSCIAAYEQMSNDGLALDLCRVSDRKLRSMVLNDEEYRTETRNIYARQRLEEMLEIERLSSLVANGGKLPEEAEEEDEDDDDYYEPRDGKRPGKKKDKMSTVDKDILNMRFKAAQLKRELRAEMVKTEGDVERDNTLFHVSFETREEIESFITAELNEGSDEVDMDELLNQEEKMPEGTTGKMRNKGKTPVPEDDEPFEMIGEDGEIIEL